MNTLSVGEIYSMLGAAGPGRLTYRIDWIGGDATCVATLLLKFVMGAPPTYVEGAHKTFATRTFIKRHRACLLVMKADGTPGSPSVRNRRHNHAALDDGKLERRTASECRRVTTAKGTIPDRAYKAAELRAAGIAATDIALRLGVTKETVYKYVTAVTQERMGT